MEKQLNLTFEKLQPEDIYLFINYQFSIKMATESHLCFVCNNLYK